MSLAVGVIGTGVMGAEHARLLRDAVRGAHLVGVCDPDALRATEAAGGTLVFTDPLALIADARVEAVIIASPDATHAPLARASIAAGKPVLCEKPLAPSAAEALSVVEAEVEAGRRFVQAGFMRRFDPAYAALKAALLAGEVGAPVILHNVHRNVSAPDWFRGPMSITNSFVHEIEISRWLLDSEITSASVAAAPGQDPLMITLETASGVIVSTEVFINAAYGYDVRAQIVGRSGSLEMAAPALIARNAALHHGHAYAENWVPRFREAYRLQLEAWAKAIAEGGATGPSAWDGFATTAIAEQVVHAMETGHRCAIALPARPALYV